jgi:hypothetical protein
MQSSLHRPTAFAAVVGHGKNHFKFEDGHLSWIGFPLMELDRQAWHTPASHLSAQDLETHSLYQIDVCQNQQRHNYQGGHTHCYSMKSSEHSVVLGEVLSNGDNYIETSSLDM